MKKYIVLGLVSVLLLPVITFAQINITGGIGGLTAAIVTFMNLVMPLLVTIAVVVVIWGVFQFILNAGDEEKRKEGRSKMLWGIVGIFLMLSVWGLVSILVNTVNIQGNIGTVLPNDLF